MKNKDDHKFDQFLKAHLKKPKEPSFDEWSSIAKEIYEERSGKQSVSFFKLWPVTTAAIFSLSLIFYNYSFYRANDVENLLNISFSTDQSWSSSTVLIDLPSEDNT